MRCLRIQMSIYNGSHETIEIEDVANAVPVFVGDRDRQIVREKKEMNGKILEGVADGQ